MSKKASCRCKASECEECPEWIFTFADLVMLMMGFFVILWVLKPNPNPPSTSAATQDDPLIKAEAEIREAFGYEPKVGSTDPVVIQMFKNRAQKSRTKAETDHGGKQDQPPLGADGKDADAQTVREGPRAVIGGRLLFDPGDDRLTPRVVRTLDTIAETVRGHRNLVMVKGHTSLDDLPEDATASQQLGLSIRRAQAVADYLTKHGVEPELVRVQGCSTFEPVSQRDYAASGQSPNRRVEVETTGTLVADVRPPTTRPAKSPGDKTTD